MGFFNKLVAKKTLGEEQFNNTVDYVKGKYLLTMESECTPVRYRLKTILHNTHRNISMCEALSYLSGVSIGATGYEVINSIINSNTDLSTIGVFTLISLFSSSATVGYGMMYKKCKKRVLDYIYNRTNAVEGLGENKYKIADVEMETETKDAIMNTAIKDLSKKYSGVDYYLEI